MAIDAFEQEEKCPACRPREPRSPSLEARHRRSVTGEKILGKGRTEKKQQTCDRLLG